MCARIIDRAYFRIGSDLRHNVQRIQYEEVKVNKVKSSLQCGMLKNSPIGRNHSKEKEERQ